MIPAFARTLLGLPEEASTVAGPIDALHLAVISITVLLSAGVAAIVGYYVLRYPRKSEGDLTPRLAASIRGELGTAAGLLALFVAFWLVGFRQYVHLEAPPKGTMPVYVTAKQWMWKFAYEDGRIANDVLTIPRNRPVKLIMTSRDVIHSFFVPAFRTKQDVLPGRYTTTWFEATSEGIFDIFCAEYCGVDHSNMHGTVRVLGPEAYAAWLRDPSRDASGERDLVAEGERVAVKRACVTCHTVDGQPHVGPTWAGLFGSQVTLAGATEATHVLADEAYLTRSMMEPNADLVLGYRPVMPSYFGILPQAEVGALVAYIKSLRDVRVAPRAPAAGVVLPRVLPELLPVDAGAP